MLTRTSSTRSRASLLSHLSVPCHFSSWRSCTTMSTASSTFTSRPTRRRRLVPPSPFLASAEGQSSSAVIGSETGASLRFRCLWNVARRAGQSLLFAVNHVLVHSTFLCLLSAPMAVVTTGWPQRHAHEGAGLYWKGWTPWTQNTLDASVHLLFPPSSRVLITVRSGAQAIR